MTSVSPMTARLLICLLALSICDWSEAGGKKTKGLVVTFHLETDPAISNPKFITPIRLGSEGREFYFSKVPAFNDRDIEWFYPFTSADGASFGAAFRLKHPAALEFHGITQNNHGKLLGIRCSTAPVQAVLIDRPIEDGVIVIWSGLQQEHLEQFREKFPHVDDIAPDSGPQFALPR